jgi:alpha-1,2-mannosyltransferase
MSATARRLAWLFAIQALVVMLLRVGGASEAETLVAGVRHFLRATQQTDSWRPMAVAEDYLTRPHDRPVYDELLNEQGVKFQYPLSSLLFTRDLSAAALNAISWASVVVIAAAVWMILQRTGRGTPLEFRADDWAVGLAIAGLTVSFYPIIIAYSLGQIQAWINAVFALAILAWVVGREDLAGVAVGLACLLKPSYVLLGVWALLRRRMRFVIPMAAVVLVGGLAAIVAYGVADNVDYLRALSIIGRRGETFYPNQSFNGMLNRLLGNGDSVKFDRAAFAPFHPVVYAGTLTAFVAFMGLALWWPRRKRAEGSVTDLAIVTLTITMTSPVAWVHHYGVVLPLLAATAPAMLITRPVGRWTTPVLLICYLTISQSLALTNRLAGTPAGIAQSYMLAGALLLLVLLCCSLQISATANVGASDRSVHQHV